MVAYTLQALKGNGWNLQPEQLVGISILTEGAGVPFSEAFHQVWPNKTAAGVLHIWARRAQINGPTPTTNAQFRAQLKGLDITLLENPIPGAVGIMFDIGATGATLEVVIPTIAPMFERLIFASPCTSLEAVQKFVDSAIAHGFTPTNLAVVANEGFFGLHQNGTYLSLQLPGSITSQGNLALSRLVYPDPNFCHIGAGGLAANWPQAYQAELEEDEELLGELLEFGSLTEVMQTAKVQWLNDFGPLP